MSGSDDKTKFMPTPTGARGAADDRTRAIPTPGSEGERQATRPREPADNAFESLDRPGDTGDATRALPLGEPPAASSSDDSTRLLGTPAPDDATAVIGATGSLGTGTPNDEATVALATGPGTGAPSADFDDDVTIVRPRAQRRPRLLVQSATGDVEEHGLDSGEVTLGRASSCTLVLANPEVSRKHARIVTGPTGSVLHVEGARRNTTVNGELIAGERTLQHGDILELASTRLVFAETADTPSFDDAQPTAEHTRAFATPAIAGIAVIVAAFGLGAYLLGPSAPPAVAPPAPPIVGTRPAIDTAEQAAAATEAVREAATQAVREVAEREATAARATARTERIGKLLYQGDIALLENRLTTPTDGSAVYAYGEVLKIDPEHEQARTKIAGIIEQYLQWSESAKASGQRSRSQLYADKAAYIRVQVPSAGDGAALDARISALGGSVP